MITLLVNCGAADIFAGLKGGGCACAAGNGEAAGGDER